jgi:hypothetical protein
MVGVLQDVAGLEHDAIATRAGAIAPGVILPVRHFAIDWTHVLVAMLGVRQWGALRTVVFRVDSNIARALL